MARGVTAAGKGAEAAAAVGKATKSRFFASGKSNSAKNYRMNNNSSSGGTHLLQHALLTVLKNTIRKIHRRLRSSMLNRDYGSRV